MTIDLDFSIALNDIAPGVVSITNKSKGGSQYEWTFEGGIPSTSSLQHPGTITFADGGEHKIHLRVFNGSKYEERTIANPTTSYSSRLLSRTSLTLSLTTDLLNLKVGCFSLLCSFLVCVHLEDVQVLHLLTQQ